MRADATHRYEFEVDGGSTFACLARTREEARQVVDAQVGGARLESSSPLGPLEGDAAWRGLLTRTGFLTRPWRDDVHSLVEVLDTVRHLPSTAASIVPVAFLPLNEIHERRLLRCQCGRSGCRPVARPGSHELLHAVEPPGDISVEMTATGAWRLGLRLGPELWPDVRDVEDNGWEGVHTHLHGAVVVGQQMLPPMASVWAVADEVLTAFTELADLQPGEMSSIAVPSTAKKRFGGEGCDANDD